MHHGTGAGFLPRRPCPRRRCRRPTCAGKTCSAVHACAIASLTLLPCGAARIHPEKALGVEIGDIHVVRNAGV